MSKLRHQAYFLVALISSLTPYKLLNFLLVWLSMFLSVLLRRSITMGQPYVFTIEPTNHCHLSCPQCDKGRGLLSRKNGFMSLEDFQPIIDQIHKHVIIVMLYFQGEPLGHPEIDKMIAYAAKKKITVIVNTNGHYITQEKAKRLCQSGLVKLIISIDATQEKTYQLYRKGGDFKQVLSGIAMLQNEKRKNARHLPILVGQYLVFAHNEKELDDMKFLYKQSQADLIKLKSAQILSEGEKKRWLPASRKHNRYRKKKNYLQRHLLCKRLWTNMVITWDGKLALCCYDKNLQYSLGQMNQENLKNLYQSARLTEYRKQTLDKKKIPAICANCNG